MKFKRIAAAVVFAALCVLCARLAAGQEGAAARTLDIDALVRDCQRDGEALSRRVFDYSWTGRTFARRTNRRGRALKETVQTHEVFPLPGRDFVVQRLVAENNQPLAPKRAAKEQRRIVTEMAQAELLAATFAEEFNTATGASDCPAFGVWTTLGGYGGHTPISFGYSDILCYGEFSSPAFERRGGRETVVLSFRPRAGFTPPSEEKAPFAKPVGLVWIDLQDRVVVRAEEWVADDARPADPRSFSRASRLRFLAYAYNAARDPADEGEPDRT